ncbi:hypothetical protein BH20ACT24_BH20ACT24_17740 [soil metagenome]
MESPPRPEAMRQAMADYVRTLHQSYHSQAQLQPPAVRGRMPLVGVPFTVIAAGVRNLHVIGTREPLAVPTGPEVELHEELDGMTWSLRFFDPVVLPGLGLIDESAGPAGERVRRALGLTTYLYHLVVQPGSELTAHHAGHAGSGLANAHAAEARDFEEIRAHAVSREPLVDEMEGAALAGLRRAQVLLAREIAPWDEAVRELDERRTPEEVRKAVLAAVREGPR